ncbi:hypothetical protein [uncultured Helicobacter sp.]|uniref:hypothetical protein n=1 Tax=uncultured Helicobacter sp. TaxID=175537 RepID=UPI002609B865|nr:hypothetical protein [uncultured Helicobacter sp.]
MRSLLGFCIVLATIIFGYYGILNVENQVLYGIYFSFEMLYDYTGWFSFGLLFFGLWLPSPYGKVFGVLAFVAALWHFLIFVHLDFGGEIAPMVQKIFSEKHLIVGGIGFLAMLFAFLASLLQIFRRFRVSFLVYLAVFFGVLHIVMLQKVLSSLYYALFAIALCALAFKLWRAKGALKDL